MEQWTPIWAQAHADMGLLCGNYKSHTVKATLYAGLGGNQVRLRLSNEAGKKDVHLVQIGIQAGSGNILPVTVGGKTECILSPGQRLYSDTIQAEVEAGMDVTVSMAFSGKTASGNQLTEAVRYSKKGNFALSRQMTPVPLSFRDLRYSMTPVIPVLSGIEVLTEEKREVIVCFGDSITQQGRWTMPLGQMLPETVVLNKGIGGNQLLSDPMSRFMAMWGPAAMGRFQRDVLEETGVTAVIFALGTNDIGMARNSSQIALHGAEKIFEGLLALNGQAKAAGLKTYIATITPRENSGGYQPWHEAERQKLNESIRIGTAFDGILDFDAVTRDQEHPARFDEPCDSGDHLHPSWVGGKRMAKEAYKVLCRR